MRNIEPVRAGEEIRVKNLKLLRNGFNPSRFANPRTRLTGPDSQASPCRAPDVRRAFHRLRCGISESHVEGVSVFSGRLRWQLNVQPVGLLPKLEPGVGPEQCH
jgi:hypothetical protein